MPPIDAVRNGMGFDEAGHWHKAKVLYMPASRRDDDPLASARGAIYGLLISSALWLVLLLAVRILRSVL
ncbi:MAG TPA: hypothetical protein VME68_07795 [Acidobacteriaceae bacterium]|nr:hypothetical protein [Acidobacteriaceae bacterium]